MKEMNPLENQLPSWQPRRPSAGLRRRLFAAPANAVSDAAKFLGWLTPVAACALFTLSVFNSGNGISTGSSRYEPMAAMILSNQNYAAYAADNFRGAQNDLFSVTFDWTNRSSSTSSMSPFSRAGMN